MRATWSFPILGMALVPLLASPAWCGDANQLSILQSGFGNELTVDQTQATNSKVLGLSIDPAITADSPTNDATSLSDRLSLTDLARQSGGNNSADVTIRSTNGGAVYLRQANPNADNPRNMATVTSIGNGVALLSQQGFDNQATLAVNGLGSPGLLNVDGQAIDGAIIQNGSGNRGTVTTGNGAGAVLVQNGSGNSAGLDTTLSSPGTSIVYTQNGNSLQALSSAQVITNAPGTTTVTQTGFNGVISRGAASVTVTQTSR